MPGLRMPRNDFQGERRRYFLHEPEFGRKKCMLELMLHRFEVPFLFGFVVADASLHDRDPSLCAILCPHGARHAPVCHDQLGRPISLGLAGTWSRNIHKERLQLLYREIPLHKVECIGIDEFSFKEGHHYMTVSPIFIPAGCCTQSKGKARRTSGPS